MKWNFQACGPTIGKDSPEPAIQTESSVKAEARKLHKWVSVYVNRIFMFWRVLKPRVRLGVTLRETISILLNIKDIEKVSKERKIRKSKQALAFVFCELCHKTGRMSEGSWIQKEKGFQANLMRRWSLKEESALASATPTVTQRNPNHSRDKLATHVWFWILESCPFDQGC